MLSSAIKKEVCNLNYEQNNLCKIKKVYNEQQKLTIIQILNQRGQIQKCMFYDEKSRLSNICVYNTNTGKQLKNVTFRQDGKTISSIREFDNSSGILRSVSFFKPDGKSVSSIIEYNEEGNEIEFSLFCDDGEIINATI